MRPFPALCLALLAVACADPNPTGPPSSSKLRPGFVVANSAANGPNVIRFKDFFATLILDPVTDLVAWGGLPANPMQLIDCGGAEDVQIADVHGAGLLQDALKALIKLDPANLHVYRLSTFVDPCVSTPLARGSGRVMYTDSDIFDSGRATDSWGYRMEGTVTLASGGTAHLLAHNRWQVLPDGTLRRIFRQVKLLGP
jgi:hypothetical protein